MPTCKANTKTGSQCKVNAVAGSDFCRFHTQESGPKTKPAEETKTLKKEVKKLVVLSSSEEASEDIPEDSEEESSDVEDLELEDEDEDEEEEEEFISDDEDGYVFVIMVKGEPKEVFSFESDAGEKAKELKGTVVKVPYNPL